MIKLKLNSNLKINELDSGIDEVDLDLEILDVIEQITSPVLLGVFSDEQLTTEFERRAKLDTDGKNP